MSFLFRMTFTGLCGFVPRQLNGDDLAQGTVLLVNTLDPPDDLNFHCSLKKHDPHFWLRNQAVSLRGKVLSVSGPLNPAALEFVDVGLPVPPPTKPRPDTNDHRDIYWVADMGELEGGTVDSECFGSLPNKRVAARVKLSAGFLSTSRIIKSGNDDLEWNFRKSATGPVSLVRAMAAEFSLTAWVNDESIRLDIYDYDTRQTSHETLWPIGGEVVVPVENSCGSEDKEGPLEDFAWFYRMSHDPSAIYLPYRTGGGDYSDTMCPPARFLPNPSA